MCCKRDPPNFKTKRGSQNLKRCQIPDAVWDGAYQNVGTKLSAPKQTYTRQVRCQIQCLPHQVSVPFCFLFLKSSPLHLLGSWSIPHGNEGYQILDAHGIVASEFPNSEAFALMLCSMPLMLFLLCIYVLQMGVFFHVCGSRGKKSCRCQMIFF